MKRVYWLIILTVSLGFGRTTADVGGDLSDASTLEQLVLSPAVADNIALIFKEFQRELVLCLEGERRANTLYITDFRMPHILISETGRVQAAGCKHEAGTVGTWHNHPSLGLNFSGISPESHARNCYLSRTDIRDFIRRRDAVVSVVSCAPHTFAYWWRGDVADGEAEVALLAAPEGQLITSGVRTERRAGDLTQARSR
ncbi:MAG: hypothetical protein V3U38_01835 [Gemmatimonadota bacterium]|nr:hypothetical protein [Candidatus Palauibacterales bacterium]